MIIRMDLPFANDHPDGPASCNWSSGWTGLLQIIIGMDRPLANDHSDWPAFCKWSYAWISLLQMIDRIEWPLANDHPDGSFSKYHPRFPSLFIFSSKDPKPKNSRILGQYTHNLLGLNPYPSQFSFHPQKYGLKARSPNWVRHAKCTWSFYVLEDKLSSPKESKRMSSKWQCSLFGV